MAENHVCEYLTYRSMSIELLYPGTEYQRRILMQDHGRVVLQVVMFCPFCGHDFRADCYWQIPGRPQENEILANARMAGELAASGCGCDGALDDGCFLCNPKAHKRPECHPTCKNYRHTAWERLDLSVNG